MEVFIQRPANLLACQQGLENIPSIYLSQVLSFKKRRVLQEIQELMDISSDDDDDSPHKVLQMTVPSPPDFFR